MGITFDYWKLSRDGLHGVRLMTPLCVCVCVRERRKRKTEREKEKEERERERERKRESPGNDWKEL